MQGQVPDTSNTFTDSAEALPVIRTASFDWSRAPWSNFRAKTGHVGRTLQRLVRYGERGSTRITTANKPLPGARGDDELTMA